MRKPFFLETISPELVRNCKILLLLQFHDIKNIIYTTKVSDNNTDSLLKIYLEFLFLDVYAKMSIYVFSLFKQF